jgi:hypothetical protein
MKFLMARSGTDPASPEAHRPVTPGPNGRATMKTTWSLAPLVMSGAFLVLGSLGASAEQAPAGTRDAASMTPAVVPARSDTSTAREPTAVGADVSVQASPVTSSDSQARRPANAVPVYKPPMRGAPGGRVGGGTRGVAGRDVFVLSVLAPDHKALTVSDQPALYWFISSDTSLPIELAIADPNATEPLLETRLPSPAPRGVHRIRLADFAVKLEPGVAYRWSVTVVPDANRRSRDILASGTIERVEPSAVLAARLQSARTGDLPFIYAEEGIWYDALAVLSDLIDGAPENGDLQRQRAALLSQARLPQITAEP